VKSNDTSKRIETMDDVQIYASIIGKMSMKTGWQPQKLISSDF